MRHARCSALAFPVALWLMATLYFGGALGQWNDDYAYDLRAPDTGEVVFGPGRTILPYFYRPLYYLSVPVLETRLDRHPAALHAISALAHGLAALLLWKLARRLGLPWRGAACATALALASPAAWDAVLWPAALPTLLAASCALGLSLLYLAFASGAIGWWGMALISALAFAIPCLNEQPASVAIALPILAWAAGVDIRRKRAAIGWAAAILPIAAYIAAFLLTAPPGIRGSTGSMTPPSELWSKAWATSREAFDALTMHGGFGRGALASGLRALAEHPARSALLAAILCASLVPWMRRWMQPEQPSDARRALRIALAGLAVFVTGFLPAIAIRNQGIEPRLCYWPSMGLAIAVAGLGAATASALGDDKRGRLALGLLASAAAILGATMMVGIQSAMRSRWLLDQREAHDLKELIPTPPLGAIFIPVWIQDRAAQTGRPAFDRAFFGPLERPWSSGPYLRHAYGRSDLLAGAWNQWIGWRPRLYPAESGLRYDDRLEAGGEALPGPLPRDQSGLKFLPAQSVIPLWIDRQGTVRIVTEITDQDGNRFLSPWAGSVPPERQARALVGHDRRNCQIQPTP